MYPAVQGRLAFRRAALFFLVAALACAQPEDLSKKSERGKELMAAGRFAEAVPIYEEMCRALPNNAGLRLNLGLALRMSGRQRDAIPIFQTVLKLEPNSLPALIS